MAMTRSQGWSISALATEFGLDRRTVAKRIEGIAPSGTVSGAQVWALVDVSAALSGGVAPADGALDLNEERARKAKEEADRLEMMNAQMRGELLARGDVDAAVAGAFARVRARMIGIPSKVAPVVAIMDNPAEVQGVLREAVYDALRELSETAVSDLCGNDGDVVEAADPAPGHDDQPVGGREATA
jgi:hypothetical protein